MSEKKQPVDLGLLEEDDEFEEFPAEGNWLGPGLWAPRTVTQALGWRRCGSKAPVGRRPREVETPPCDRLGVLSVTVGLGGEAERLCFLVARSHSDLGPSGCPGWLVLLLVSRVTRHLVHVYITPFPFIFYWFSCLPLPLNLPYEVVPD